MDCTAPPDGSLWGGRAGESGNSAGDDLSCVAQDIRQERTVGRALAWIWIELV